MFKKSPYLNWLLPTILCWCVLSFHFAQENKSITAKALANVIEKDIAYKEKTLQKLLSDSNKLNRIFENRISYDEVKQLEQLPFFIYAYSNNELVFWNNNNVISNSNDSSISNVPTLFHCNGTFLKECFSFSKDKKNEVIVFLFPIVYKYPFENEYLSSHLSVNENIPANINIFQEKTRESAAVKNLSGNPLFYIVVDKNIETKPCNFTIAMLIISLCLSIIWLTLIAIDLSRRKSFWAGFLLLTGSILIVFGYVKVVGLPFQLYDLQLFSPHLYASSVALPSFGYLIANILATLWLLLFLVFVPSFKKIKNSFAIKSLHITISVFCFGLICFLPINLIKSIVLDSRISFDVAHFYAITSYTIAGLFCVLIIIFEAVLGIVFLSELLRNCFKKSVFYWVIFTTSVLISLGFVDKHNLHDYIFGIGWTALVLLMLNSNFVIKPKRFLSGSSIFWSVFIIASTTFVLFYFSNQKQEIDRKAFAERIVNQGDKMMEFLFEDIALNLQQDKWIQSYLHEPERETRILIDEHLNSGFLSGTLNRFDSKVYLFDANKKALHNGDTTSFKNVEEIISKSDSVGQYLFHFEDKKKGSFYASLIPISEEEDSVYGFVLINLKPKIGKPETVYPELLQPESLTEIQTAENYKYAVYNCGLLQTQSGNYFFPNQLGRKIEHAFQYKIDSEKTVVIIQLHNKIVEVITLFSYLLGLFIIVAILVLSVRYALYLTKNERKAIVHLTLQKRIQLALISLAALSLLIIGTVTVSFFVNQSKDANKTKLQETMMVAERSVQQYFQDSKITPDAYDFDKITESASFRNFINRLVEEHGIDINIYNIYGSLNATSQEGIYNKSVLARIMMPDAYFMLSQKNSSAVVLEEKIGNLKYLSSYLPFHDDNGNTLGYINIPFFSSQKELMYQISNLAVAMVDLFALIFLVSSLFTVVITRWLTSKLQMIIDKFKGFNLKANELLEWPYNDEIGLLVSEYNKMVKTVEEQALLLAKNERESAWREMAKQVAHEIKNPLTPMKLNVQYLQRALNNNNPNAKEMTMQVAQSMIEQIDNLSHIASAFSDFAKMPEAIPEEIELNTFIINSTEIYKRNIDIALPSTSNNLNVFIDKSQLLRVITNLIKNAMEAIPENRVGKIDISLLSKAGNAVIEIKDNGTGIQDDIVEHIFNPYFTTKGSGTGLGLAMTKRIVEFWNGRIWFKTSEQGTSFFIELPLI